MDEGRKRVIGIMVAILASLHMQTAEDLFGGPPGSPQVVSFASKRPGCYPPSKQQERTVSPEEQCRSCYTSHHPERTHESKYTVLFVVEDERRTLPSQSLKTLSVGFRQR